MKRKIDFLIVALFAVVLFASCERVAPNYAGVLMENYGKQGKEDFKIVAGKVSTWELGTELFQVPLFDQRGEFSDPVTLKAADNTEFTARPTYSYKVMKNRAIDIVFDNKKIGGILTESKMSEEIVKYLVVGIGINTNKTKFNKEIKNIATSIKNEFNIEVDNFDFIAEFCNRFERRLFRKIYIINIL